MLHMQHEFTARVVTIIWPLYEVKLLKNGMDKVVLRSPEKFALS